MGSYDYDETGVIFNYFLLTLLSVILIPLTLTVRKTSTKSKYLLVILGWCFFSYVLYSAITTPFTETGRWDPYEILGVSPDADNSTIRKAFKKLSLKYHPDKVTENKEETEKLFVEISKAHKVLTDQEARETWETTGHPDGTQASKLGLALPKWLIEEQNSWIVLGFYGICFGLLLPYFVSRWWNSAQETTEKISSVTMGMFYRDLKDNFRFKSLLELISKAHEFEGLSVKQPVDSFIKKVPFECKNPSQPSQRVLLYVYAHFHKIDVEPEVQKEIHHVLVKCTQLVSGLMQIAAARGLLTVMLHIIELHQHLVQGLGYHESELLLLPFFDDELLKHCKTKKRNISTIAQLLALESTELNSLLRNLSPEQIETVLKEANKYPRIQILKASMAVEGEPCIVPNSLVTLTVKFRVFYGSDTQDQAKEFLLEDDKEEEKGDSKWWEDKMALVSDAYAPRFPVPKKPAYWVLFANTSMQRLISLGKAYVLKEETVTTAKLQFQAPPNDGQWTFQVYVKCDGYIGKEVIVPVVLKVEPSQEEPEPTHDMYSSSDSEQETLPTKKNFNSPKVKAQVQKKRQASKLKERALHEDSSDTDDFQERLAESESDTE